MKKNPQKKKTISREEMLERHRQKKWVADEAEWNEFSRRAISGLQYQPEGESLHQTLGRIEKKVRRRHQPTRKIGLPQALSIAASLALLIFAVYWLAPRPQDTQALATRYFEYLPSAVKEGSLSRTGNGPLAGLRAEAVRSYEGEKYDDAERLTRAYLSEAPQDNEMRFYYGLILLGRGDAQSATPHLEAAQRQPPQPAYQRPASWYLGLAYLRQGKTEAARQLFKELSAGADRYATQSRSILEEL